MAQIGIKISAEWFQSDIVNRPSHQQVVWQSFEQTAGFCCYELAQWQLFVWGDAAQRSMDAMIIQGVVQQQPVTVFGRSWIAIHRHITHLQGATDQLGVFPILLQQCQTDWLICSDRPMLSKLLGGPPTLSADSMRQMLCFGQILDDQSIIQGAHHLAAAQHFALQHNRVVVTALAQRKPLSETRMSNFDQALEAVVEAVRASLHHAVNPMLSLSGGVDSRLIYAACLAIGKKIPALCYGEANSDDVKIATQLAEVGAIPLFTGHAQDLEPCWQVSKRVSSVGLGEVPMHHAHALVNASLLAQTQNSTVITGTGAEAYRAFYYDRGMPGFELLDIPCLHNLWWPRIQRYIREEFFKLASEMFAIVPQLESMVRPTFETMLTSRLQSNVDCAKAADQFYLDVRVCRMVVAGQQLLDPYYQRSHPFLAPEVLSTLGNLPAYYKVSSRFHRQAIIRLAPQLAQIPWDKTGLPLASGLPMACRYPGLMRYIGKPAHYGKQAIPMFSQFHSGQLPYEHVLDSILSYIGIEDKKMRRRQIWQLLQSRALPHVKGLTEVWSHLLTEAPAVRGGRT